MSHEQPSGPYLEAIRRGFQFARELDRRCGPVHLLIALLDQGTSEVLRALSQAGLDPVVVRNAAADAIGAAGGLLSIAMPLLTAAGTLDRPPLPVADLDGRAWNALCWRQEHLPPGRLRRPSDYEALSRLEWAAASLVPPTDHPFLPKGAAALAPEYGEWSG